MIYFFYWKYIYYKLHIFWLSRYLKVKIYLYLALWIDWLISQKLIFTTFREARILDV